MVLQKDITFLPVAEVFPIPVLAIGYQRTPHLISTFVFNYFHAVKPMFNLITFNNHHRRIEKSGTEWFG